MKEGRKREEEKRERGCREKEKDGGRKQENEGGQS